MNNWRLLLFAVFCTFQPILSEENLFNGRERCIIQRPDSSRGDTRLLGYQYLSTPISEFRRVNVLDDIDQHDSRYSERVLKNHNEGLDEDIRNTDRRTRSLDRIRVSLVSRHRYAETVNRNNQRFDRRSISRNDRTESQIRNIREEKRTDIDTQNRNRRLSRSLANNARSYRSQALNHDDRRKYERDVTRTRSILSRNIESRNIPTRRTVNQRQLEDVQYRPVQSNIRLSLNGNDNIEHREFVQRSEFDESRNIRRELRSNSAKVYYTILGSDQSIRRNNERLHPQARHDVRRNRQQSVRTESDVRLFNAEIENRRNTPVTVNHLRRNDIRRSESFRPHNERNLQNGYRQEFENSVRRDDFIMKKRTTRDAQMRENKVDARDDFNMKKRTTRDAQMRENKVDARDSIARAVREEKESSRNSIRDGNMNNRDRAFDRNLSIRSQRQFRSELQTKMRRELTTRNTRIDNTDFNRITNDERAPMKENNRIRINDNERRKSDTLRKQDLSDIRNIKHDNGKGENLENNQRRFIRDESRMTRQDRSSFRQNMERGNSQRLRIIENIRVNREDRTIRRISITRDNRVSNKYVREENEKEIRSQRTNDSATSSRGMPSEQEFRFEFQHLLYLVQAVYLFGLFIKLPQRKEGYEKKTMFGVWNKTPKVIKVD